MGAMRQFYSDYRTVNGVRIPFVVESEQQGQSLLITFSEVAFDRDLTPEALEAEAGGGGE